MIRQDEPGGVLGFIRSHLENLDRSVEEIRTDVKKLLPLEQRVEAIEGWRWKEVNPQLREAQAERDRRKGIREDAQHDGNLIQIRYFKYGVIGLAISTLVGVFSLVLALHTAHIIF